jgi:L-alanine-DL-glutamate epimerase-like enolase superfamily enzyme
VRRIVDEGFKAVKLRFHRADPREDLAVVEAVRGAVGDRIEIMVDGNQAGVEPGYGGHRTWGFQLALEVARELERLGCYWLEEPLPRHDYESLRRLRAVSPTPIAGGEVNQQLHDLQRLLLDGCYHILQPDVTLCEGLLRLRGLATIAHGMSVLVNPHSWGDALGMVANLHLAAAIPNTSYFEFPHDPPAFPTGAYQSTLKNPLIVKDGMVQVPQEPGLGVELQDWIFG